MESTTDTASKRSASGERANGEPCPGCQQPLPLRAKRPDEITTHWECTRCRAPFTGVLLKKAIPSMASQVRLSQKHFDTTGIPAVPVELRELVGEFLICRANQSPPDDDRRKSVRVPQQLDVVVAPLDDEWLPQGKPIQGIVVDLAADGLGMITTAPIGAPYVAAQIGSLDGFVQLLGKVAWSQDSGHGFHNSGLQFVARFGRSKELPRV
jgi:hypothetical protein